MNAREELKAITPHAVPLAVAVAFTAAAVLPRVFAPAAGLAAMLVLLVPAAVIAALTGALPRMPAMRVVAAWAAAVIVLGTAALLSDNPAVALAGRIESRTGWAMWAVALAWLLIVAAQHPHERPRLPATVALLGVVAAGAAVLDATGVLQTGSAWSDKPAGVFGNALSLGQFEVLAFGSALAWAAGAASRRQRTIAIVAAACCAGAVVLSASRGAMLGAILGGLAWLAATAPPRAPRWAPRVAVVALTAAAVLGIALVAVTLAAPDSSLARVADDLTTDRLTLWRGAVLDVADDPVLGDGPGLSSSVARWTISEEWGLRILWANDPHSVVFYWLAGSGILGLIAFAAAVWLTTAGCIAGARSSPRSSVLLVAIAGWAATVLFTWVDPFSLIVAAALCGTMLAAAGEDEPGSASRHVVPRVALALAGAVSVLVLIAAVALGPGLGDEYRWASLVGSSSSNRLWFAREVIKDGADPTYAAWILSEGVPASVAAGEYGPDDAASIALSVMRGFGSDTSWYAPMALASVETAFRAREAGLMTIDDVETTIAQARLADPQSGCVDFIATDRFLQMGLERRALAHARMALATPLDPAVRARLERFTDGTSR